LKLFPLDSDFKAKLHQILFRLGLRPRPHCGSLQHSPDPLDGFKGPTYKRMEGKRRGIEDGKGGKGLGKEEGPTSKGRGEDGKGGEREKGKGERREGKGEGERRGLCSCPESYGALTAFMS